VFAGRLVPEFLTSELNDGSGVTTQTTKPEALFVADIGDFLPDHIVLFDTPDVDSIAKQHWELAENIRAAGDVLVAVLTDEKYNDAV